MLYACTSVDSDKLAAIQDLEREIGGTVIAMTAIDTRPAEVDGSALAKIRALEERLGVVLVAVEG